MLEQEEKNRDFLKRLKEANGYYEGKTLVAYAGKGQDQKNLVGHVYYNCSKFETNPRLLNRVVHPIAEELKTFLFNVVSKEKNPFVSGKRIYVVGAPMGGLAVGYELARQLKFVVENSVGTTRYFYANYVFIEKEILKLKTPEAKEEFLLKFIRHEIPEESLVIVAEDVINNYSTINLMLKGIEENGSKVIGLACLMNRSMTITYTQEGRIIQVFSTAHIPTEQWEQSSQKVQDYLASGKKIIMKPKEKESWSFLMQEMKKDKGGS
jgi:orotate phosphoribosyltransferase